MNWREGILWYVSRFGQTLPLKKRSCNTFGGAFSFWAPPKKWHRKIATSFCGRWAPYKWPKRNAFTGVISPLPVEFFFHLYIWNLKSHVPISRRPGKYHTAPWLCVAPHFLPTKTLGKRIERSWKLHVFPPKTNIFRIFFGKCWFERQVSFWNGPFLGDILIFGRAKIPRKKRYHWLNTANKSCHVKSERNRKWMVSYRAICVNIPLADNILHQFMRQIYANIPYHDCKSITVNWCKLDIVQVFVHQLYEHAANHHCLQLQWSLHLCCHILEVLRKRVVLNVAPKVSQTPTYWNTHNNDVSEAYAFASFFTVALWMQTFSKRFLETPKNGKSSWTWISDINNRFCFYQTSQEWEDTNFENHTNSGYGRLRGSQIS